MLRSLRGRQRSNPAVHYQPFCYSLPMPLAAGTRVGPYEIVAPLGSGGMGEVYRARDPRIAREVAIKILPASLVSDPDRLARFTQEARTAGGLNHPNLLVIFDAGTHEGNPYLVTELLEGETLRDRLARDAVPLRKAVDWAMQIADGVAAAHEKNIVHRDIKPENIFLTHSERIKVLDFGLAKLVAGAGADEAESPTAVQRTDPGAVVGTPGYMAPEQIRAEPVDERSDVFSLGIVLAEMATGRNPFQQPTRVETMTAILQSDVHLPESLPPGLVRIIDHMLAKRPAARFQSMRDVAFALQLLSGSGASGESRTDTGVHPAIEPTAIQPEFRSITYRRGRIGTARFTPEGSIVYGAAWEGNPLEIFVSYPGTPEAREIGVRDADVLSVSASGELAVSLGRHFLGGWVSTGTLARVPLAGGTPRRICEDVVDADWAPDGKNFAIIRRLEQTFALEFPIGRRLYESAGWLSHVRFSRDATRLGFIEHQWFGDDAGRPMVIDLNGGIVMAPGAPLSGTSGLAWSAERNEVWIAGDRHPFGRDILGFDMDGNSRVVLAAPGQVTICDVSRNGDLLITHDAWRREVYAARHGEPAERNLAWYNWPFLSDLSQDGSQILIDEQSAGTTGSDAPFFVRPVDGGPAVHYGDGRARAISPDGAWIAASTGGAGHLELIPTGVGESRLVRCDQYEALNWWYWFPDGSRLLVVGSRADKTRLCLSIPLDGSEPTPVAHGSLGFPGAISPDGRYFISIDPGDRMLRYALDGGTETVPVRGVKPGEWPIRWSSDGRYLYVYERGKTATSIDRIDLETGERTEWQAIRPADQAGIVDIFPVWITPDGEHYAIGYRRCLSDLYLVSKPSSQQK